MAYAPVGHPVSGCFKEKSYKKEFEFYEGVDEWGMGIGATHVVYLHGDNQRYARVLKTVAYICVDEDDYGKPVWEKWDIKTLWNGN